MLEHQILAKTERYVEEAMANMEPGHDYLHVQRVRKMALRLASSVKCDAFLVEMLALLHDLEDHKFHLKNKVQDILDRLDLSEERKTAILFILPHLSFSKYPTLPEDFPIEGKIVQDADRLDAIGAIGIARAFSYGGNKNRRMYGTLDSTIQHFDDKLLKLNQYLYLEESRQIAKGRMKLLKAFYNEFLKEIA